PRLSWRLDDKREGAVQKAYVVTFSTDSAALTSVPSAPTRTSVPSAPTGTSAPIGTSTPSGPNTPILWTTGRRDSPDQLTVYEGPTLLPFTRYYWRVDVWDKDGQLSTSTITSFETGMIDMTNWKGAWISDS